MHAYRLFQRQEVLRQWSPTSQKAELDAHLAIQHFLGFIHQAQKQLGAG